MAAQLAVTVAVSLALASVPSARALPPPSNDPARCDRVQLAKFRATRASFSMEVGSGALPEAVLDLRACDFHGADLVSEVLSGGILDGANFSDANLTKVDASRARARGGNFAGAKLVDTNLFEVDFSDADMRGAVFTNAVLSSVSFRNAKLQGADFEGALLSSSDVNTLCTNTTLEDEARAVLGCR